jgi:hypothetical protein
VIAPWRGEREWVPVSNPALCRVVDMRKDGRTLRLFRGRRGYFYSPPLGSPIRGFTAHVGGRTPSRVYNWVSPHFLSLWLFLSSPSACVSSEVAVLYYVLHCSVFTAVLLTVVGTMYMY